MNYVLPRHVYFCCCGDAFTVLDCRADKYWAIVGPHAEVLRKLIDRNKIDGTMKAHADAVAELVGNGVLTTDAASGKPVVPTTFEAARLPLQEPDAGGLQPNLLHRLCFVRACVAAAVRLRWLKFERTTQAVEQRKKSCRAIPHDMEKVRTLTAIFKKLRPLYPRKYLCIFDSLALLQFLSYYRVFPTWVFGVRLDHSSPHCWLQADEFLLDGDPEETADLIPVMAL